MSNKGKGIYSGEGIIQAVETLSTIAEMDLSSDLGVTEDHIFDIQGKEINFRTVHWMLLENTAESIEHVRDVFKVILSYLEDFYRHENPRLHEHKSLANIKGIMVVVGEAAKKLDKFSSLFEGHDVESVTELDEYLALQAFYERHIAKQDRSLNLNRLVPPRLSQRGARISLARRKGIKNRAVNMDRARRDIDYELFYMQKEGGESFFSAELIRNLKLVSDFGGHFAVPRGKDPLLRMKIWRDRYQNATARDILIAVGHRLDAFYENVANYKNEDLSREINQMVMALMLCANPRNLLRNAPIKSCSGYFKDFLFFFREILQSRGYQKLVRYNPNRGRKDFQGQLDLIHQVGQALYTVGKGLSEVKEVVGQFFEERQGQFVQERYRDLPLTSILDSSYRTMQEIFRLHPDGPLNRLLEALEFTHANGYDSLHQGNFPTRLFSLFNGDKKTVMVRVPSPTNQKRVDKVYINEELRAMLRSLPKDTVRRKGLFINLQDRTDWKEHHRCVALENLPNEAKFKEYLQVATLARSTEFYHQLAPYDQMDTAAEFKEQLLDQVLGSDTGYFIPPCIRKELTKTFLGELVKGIHTVFFAKSKRLTRPERLDFIELFHLFLSAKILETVDPTAMSFVCKDGLDAGMTMTIEFHLFLVLLTRGTLTEEEERYLLVILHTPTMMVRERAIHPEMFERMLSVIRRIEGTRHDAKTQGAFLTKIKRTFLPLFKSELLSTSNFRAPIATRVLSA